MASETMASSILSTTDLSNDSRERAARASIRIRYFKVFRLFEAAFAPRNRSVALAMNLRLGPGPAHLRDPQDESSNGDNPGGQ